MHANLPLTVVENSSAPPPPPVTGTGSAQRTHAGLTFSPKACAEMNWRRRVRTPLSKIVGRCWVTGDYRTSGIRESLTRGKDAGIGSTVLSTSVSVLLFPR